MALNIIPLSLFVKADKPPPTLNFSWEETTFSYMIQKDWNGESINQNYSGTYNDTYTTKSSYYNATTDVMTHGIHEVEHQANYSWVETTSIIGNITVNFDFQVYQVTIDYGTNIKVIWIALKQGIMEYDIYFSSHITNYSYFEEYHQYRENQYSAFNYSTGVWFAPWNNTDEVFGEKHFNNVRNDTRFPYFLHSYRYMEFSSPIILTIQLFTTEKRDRIAWINMMQDFLIYKDSDSNGIISVADKQSGSLSGLFSSDERVGSLLPGIFNMYGVYHEDYDGTGTPSSGYALYPLDKNVSEIASSISFTPPTSTPDANVTWGIQYPAFPTYAKFSDGIAVEPFKSKYNSSYVNSCPTDYSYEFDYNIGKSYTNLDTTWEIGKITNASLYNTVQGYGIVVPQYNFFLSTFNIDEIDTKELSLPCDKFSFESNDTLVAEINMGGPNKKNYTLYDFPAIDENNEFEFQGGSIHPMVMAVDELLGHWETPETNVLYTLIDIVKQDPTFNIVDSLYRVETQNYPVWSGEKLRHDPTLTVYYEPYEIIDDRGGDKISGYDILALLGIAGLMTAVIVLKQRKLKIKS